MVSNIVPCSLVCSVGLLSNFAPLDNVLMGVQKPIQVSSMFFSIVRAKWTNPDMVVCETSTYLVDWVVQMILTFDLGFVELFFARDLTVVVCFVFVIDHLTRNDETAIKTDQK